MELTRSRGYPTTWDSDLVLKLSTDSYSPEDRPDWPAVAEAPDTYRGAFRAGEEGRKAVDLGACYAASVACGQELPAGGGAR
jgi:hypothetical protein